MDRDKKEQLRQLIFQKALKWNEGTTPSGESTKWLFDLREILLTAQGSRLASEALVGYIAQDDAQLLGGLSLAAESLTCNTLLECKKRGKRIQGFIVRKKVNNFGLRKKVEGPISKGDKAIIVDDIVNSGQSVLEVIEALEKQGVEIVKILTIIGFQKKGYQLLKERGYTLDWLFTLEDFGLEKKKTYTYQSPSLIQSLSPSVEEIHGTQINESTIEQYDEHGKLVWTQPVDEKILFVSEDQENVYLTVSSGLRKCAITILNKKDGRFLEKIPVQSQVTSKPLSNGEFLFFSSAKNLCCYDITKREQRWTLSVRSAQGSLLDQEEGCLYFSTGNEFLCISLQGEVIWRKHVGFVPLPFRVQNNHIYLINSYGVFFCLDKQNGHLEWIYEFKNKPQCMDLFTTQISVACEGNFLIQLDSTTGTMQSCSKLSQGEISDISYKGDQLRVCVEEKWYDFKL